MLYYDVSAEMMKDFADVFNIEFVHIIKITTVESLEGKLTVSDFIWKLKQV